MFPPVPKKGMVRLLKRALFNARQHVKRAFLARDGKQKGHLACYEGTFKHRSFNLTLIICSLYYKFAFQLKLFFPQFPYFRIHFWQWLEIRARIPSQYRLKIRALIPSQYRLKIRLCTISISYRYWLVVRPYFIVYLMILYN